MSEKGGAAAAVAAMTAKAKLAGLWVDRSERTSLKGDLDSLSDAELAAIVRQGESQPVQVNPEPKKLN
jgi:hypothetical protein